MKKMTQVALASIKIYMLALFFIVTAEAAPHISDYSGTRLHQKDLEREKGVATGVCPDDRNHFCTIDKDKQGDAQQDVQIPHKTLDGSKQGFDHHDGEIFNKTHLDKSSTKLNSVKSPEENLRGKNGVASGNLDHFPVAPKTNKLGQASRNSSDAVAPLIMTTTPSVTELQAAQGKAELVQGVSKTASDNDKDLGRKIGK